MVRRTTATAPALAALGLLDPSLSRGEGFGCIGEAGTIEKARHHNEVGSVEAAKLKAFDRG